MKISVAESRIMDVLWRAGGPMAVEDVTEALAGESGWSEGTVRTLMTRLKKKKAVAAHKEGRRLFYRPLVDRQAYLRAESKSIVNRLYEGHIGAFVASFTEQEKLSDEEIAELKRLVEALDRDR